MATTIPKKRWASGWSCEVEGWTGGRVGRSINRQVRSISPHSGSTYPALSSPSQVSQPCGLGTRGQRGSRPRGLGSLLTMTASLRSSTWTSRSTLKPGLGLGLPSCCQTVSSPEPLTGQSWVSVNFLYLSSPAPHKPGLVTEAPCSTPVQGGREDPSHSTFLCPENEGLEDLRQELAVLGQEFRAH